MGRHNFVSTELVKQMDFSIIETPVFNVKLGDGCRVTLSGLCKQVELKLSDYKIVADCYQFPLGGVDVILGVAWLETLGDIQVNWKKLTMKFQSGSREVVCLLRDNSLIRSPASLRSIKKTGNVDFAAILWPTDIQLTMGNV